MARPSREVPANLPIRSSALYKRYTLLSLTTAAGLNTSFSSHFTFLFKIGQVKVRSPGLSTGFTESTFINGSIAQLVSGFVFVVSTFESGVGLQLRIQHSISAKLATLKIVFRIIVCIFRFEGNYENKKEKTG
jgi:hypothetical protein